jgi:hypothetical protein
VILRLATMPATLLGPNDADYKGTVPKRMRYLAPDVGAALLALEKDVGTLVYTDMWRSAESSLVARRVKRGVQPPAYSPHNYGIAVDLDLHATMKLRGWKYNYLLEVMKAHGWFCHRRDGLGPDDMEAWHFNYLGDDSDKYLTHVDIDNHVTWANAAESRIYERYGQQFVLSPKEIQTSLVQLHMYKGDIDENVRSLLCREAVMSFQRAWGLAEDGDPGPKTQRTLAFVTATKSIIDTIT